ncbi:MAG: glutathione S-transferase family protein [Oceanicoccus sp.]|uniref:glutathione S-transferase family protein n=1 Tax=Oceanicoccus sp. TaxID=2691044 RepID=UPI0026340C48|nr:glutathione S-transferase family protein [Oceanicoccus sp.]MDG1772780.1 glutathione S-transferase family protein [Oceanicoccus sp.]
MKIYTFEAAPNPRRLKLFLGYKGVDIETETINIRDGEQFSDSFKAINPDCTVPALQLDDGTVITNVIAACLYLESLYPEKPLLGLTPLEQAKIVSWDHSIFTEGFTAVAEMLRNGSEAFKGRALPGAVALEQIPGLVDRGQIRLQAFFNKLDTHLADREFIVGNAISLADIDLYALCDFAKWVKQSIPEDCRHLQSWYQRMVKELGEK